MLGGAGLGQFPFQFRDAAVAQLGHPRQIASAAGRLQIQFRPLQFFLDLSRTVQGQLLRLPDLFQVVVLAFQPSDFLLQQVQTFFRRLVALLLQRLAFDLELDQASVEPIHFLRLGIDLHADAAGRFIHQVDGLVGQIAVGDVAMRQRGGGDDGRIGDIDAVMDFVALFQAAQNRNAVLDARLVDQHLLKAPLQRRILFHVLAVLIQGGGADAVQLAARQRRLEHVAGIHRTLGLAGTDHGVQFVDE